MIADLRGGATWAERTAVPGPRCESCGGRTAGAKPFCLAHILLMPYAQDVRVGIARYRSLSKRGRLGIDDELVQDVKTLMARGLLSPPALSRNMPGAVGPGRVADCMRVLLRAGEIEFVDRAWRVVA